LAGIGDGEVKFKLGLDDGSGYRQIHNRFLGEVEGSVLRLDHDKGGGIRQMQRDMVQGKIRVNDNTGRMAGKVS